MNINDYKDVNGNVLVSETLVSDIIDGKANKQQENWITPTLLNGWTQVEGKSPVGYMKDEFGFIHLRGQAKGGISGIMFTLPSGYTPAYNMDFASIKDSGIAQVGIAASTGGVYTNGTAALFYSLDGIVFKAGA